MKIDRKRYIEWMADTYILNLSKLNLIDNNLDPIEDEAIKEVIRRAFISGAVLNLEWPLVDEDNIIELINKYPKGIKKENENNK